MELSECSVLYCTVSKHAWVRDKKPKTMMEAGKLADDYIGNRKFEYGARNQEKRV